MIGNLPLFIEHRELTDADIVSYSFGDMDALYLRGQWTMHRNDRAISTIWKGCPHLGDDLQKEVLPCYPAALLPTACPPRRPAAALLPCCPAALLPCCPAAHRLPAASAVSC